MFTFRVLTVGIEKRCLIPSRVQRLPTVGTSLSALTARFEPRSELGLGLDISYQITDKLLISQKFTQIYSQACLQVLTKSTLH